MEHGAGIVSVDMVRDQMGDESDLTYASTRKYLRMVDGASRIFTQFTRRSFVPYRQTRTFDARGEHISAYQLKLDADLLAVETLTNGNSETIASSNYVLRPSNVTPHHSIQLKDNASVTWTYSGAWEGAISIDGWWGFHENYASAWSSSGDSVQDGSGINATTTTVTVTDANGTDANYMRRFEIGQWIKIDDECMRVVAVDTNTNKLTVIRGQLGTTAATHANAAAITSYTAQYDIVQACVGLIVWLERNKGSAGETIWYAGDSQVNLNQAPQYIGDTMKAYRRARIYTI